MGFSIRYQDSEETIKVIVLDTTKFIHPETGYDNPTALKKILHNSGIKGC